jgi:hypothetical protein
VQVEWKVGRLAPIDLESQHALLGSVSIESFTPELGICLPGDRREDWGCG